MDDLKMSICTDFFCSFNHLIIRILGLSICIVSERISDCIFAMMSDQRIGIPTECNFFHRKKKKYVEANNSEKQKYSNRDVCKLAYAFVFNYHAISISNCCIYTHSCRFCRYFRACLW